MLFILKVSFIFVLSASDLKPDSLKTTLVMLSDFSLIISSVISFVILSSKQISNAHNQLNRCYLFFLLVMLNQYHI